MRSIEYRQLASILGFFLIVQLAGVLIAFGLITPGVVQPAAAAGGGLSGQVFIYFAYLVAAAVVLVLLFRSRHGPVLFKGMEAIVVGIASFYLFLIVLSFAFPGSVALPVGIAALGAVALVAGKNKWPWLRNTAAIISSIGVGLVLGLFFSFIAAFVLMALVAAYDYIAVFVTRHMLTLAKASIQGNTALMVGSYEVELVPRGSVRKAEASRMLSLFKGTKNEELRKLVKRGGIPLPSLSALGAGDLAIPLMLAVSAYMTYFSYFFSVVLVASTCFGLVFAMYVSKRWGTALPAIPPLFSAACVGLGAYTLSTSAPDWQLAALLFVAAAAILALMLVTVIRRSRKGLSARIE
jgi:presenilin-like A22 family membrane protease